VFLTSPASTTLPISLSGFSALRAHPPTHPHRQTATMPRHHFCAFSQFTPASTGWWFASSRQRSPKKKTKTPLDFFGFFGYIGL